VTVSVKGAVTVSVRADAGAGAGLSGPPARRRGSGGVTDSLSGSRLARVGAWGSTPPILGRSRFLSRHKRMSRPCGSRSWSTFLGGGDRIRRDDRSCLGCQKLSRVGVAVWLDANEHATPVDADCASGKHDRFNCFAKIAIAGGVGCTCCCASVLPETEQGLALRACRRGHGFTFLRDGVQRVRWRWAGVVLPCEAARGPPCKAVERLMLPL